MPIRRYPLTVSILLATYAPMALAYVGPGLGVSAIAAVLGIFAGILMLLVGSIWYPMKRLFGRFKSRD